MTSIDSKEEFMAAWGYDNSLKIKEIEAKVAFIRGQQHRVQLNHLLKICPFCGGKATIISQTKLAGNSHYEVKMVKCVVCGASTAAKLSDECSDDDITYLWNRRVSLR